MPKLMPWWFMPSAIWDAVEAKYGSCGPTYCDRGPGVQGQATELADESRFYSISRFDRDHALSLAKLGERSMESRDEMLMGDDAVFADA